jgi:SAM-dependent methyltransferase
MLLQKVIAAVRNPSKIACFLRWQVNRRLVRTVLVSSEVFHEFRGERYPDALNHGNASSRVAEKALEYCTGVGLDIGAATWPLPGAIPIRDEPHQNAYKLDLFPDSSLDFIFSSHCLEHLDRWKEALGLWSRKLKAGGYLVLYLPHESMKMWRKCGPWVGLGHKWIPTHQVLRPFLDDLGFEIVEYNADRDAYWSFHIVGRRKELLEIARRNPRA